MLFAAIASFTVGFFCGIKVTRSKMKLERKEPKRDDSVIYDEVKFVQQSFKTDPNEAYGTAWSLK